MVLDESTLLGQLSHRKERRKEKRKIRRALSIYFATMRRDAQRRDDAVCYIYISRAGRCITYTIDSIGYYTMVKHVFYSFFFSGAGGAVEREQPP